MEKILPFFPLNNTVKSDNAMSLVIAIVIYVVVAVVLGVLLALLGGIPVVGIITRIVGILVWIYEVVGIVLAILTFVQK